MAKVHKIDFSNYIDPMAISDIVSSKTYNGGKWAANTTLGNTPKGVTKIILPIDMHFFRINVITTAEPETKVRTHSHDEPTFRYIISGSLTVNGVQYSPGEWMVIPENFQYDIETSTGYKTIMGYGEACTTPGGDD